MSRLARILTAVVAALSLVAFSAPQLVGADHTQSSAGGAIGCCKLR